YMPLQDPKRCVKCGEVKPRAEFFLRNKDKTLVKPECKLCSRLIQHEKSAYYREYHKRRYAEDPAFRERTIAGIMNGRDMVKHRAQDLVYHTIKRGKLERKP